MKYHHSTIRALSLAFVPVLLLAACGGNPEPKPSMDMPTAAQPAAHIPAITPSTVPGTLQCQECADEGMMEANVFGSIEMNSVACRERWGTEVQILRKESKNDVPIYQVRTPSCTGWVSSRLVQR